MSSRLHTGANRQKFFQRGFSLVTAVISLTILSLLAAFIIGIRAYQDSSVTLDVLGTRAYSAARVGIEWGAYQALRPGPCAVGLVTNSFALTGSLTGFTATVATTGSQFNEAGTVITMCSIVSTACNQPSAGACPNATHGANYAERQITVTVGQP